jgi:hypothetical protein
MKTNTIFSRPLFLFLSVILCANLLYAQDKKAGIKNAVETRQFIFKAETALPLSGGARQLTADYELKISRTSVTSYLPYFGRAYSADYNSTQGGINFTSTKFNYSTNPGKKGGWDIDIKPKDVNDTRELSLSISENGYATLQVTSTNRQAISFTGYITALQ